MSDVYEIGVSLALDDGVSTGIETARREMAQLAGVLQAGGVSVQMLRDAAEQALRLPSLGRAEAKPAPRAEPRAAAPDTPAGPPEEVQKRAQEVDETAIALPVVQAASPAGPPGPLPAIAGPRGAAQVPPSGRIEPARPRQTPVAPPIPSITILADQQAVPPVPLQAAMERSAAPRAVPAEGLPASAWVQPGPVAAPPAPHAQMPAAQVGTPVLQAESVWAPVPEMAPRPPSLSVEEQSVLPPSLPLPPVTIATVAPPAVTVTRPTPAPQDPVAPVMLGPAYAPPGMAPLPPEPETTAAWPGQMPMAPPAVAPPRPAAPRESARSTQGPNEGDVFLDGQLVGRWMSRFLNREAGRASSGPTGFDARRGQLMPGPTVGG